MKTFPVLEAEPMGAISADKSLQPGVIGRTGGAIPPTGANLLILMSVDKLNERNHYVLARLVRDVEGQYAKFKGGEIVKARNINRGKCTIERNRWKGSLVPLCNVLAGIPTSAMDFDV